MLTLRVLSPEDWPVWRDVRLAALADAPDAFKSRLEDWHRGGAKRWRARLESPGSHNVIAFLDGEPVGLASGVPGDGDAAELHSVWVSPLARGRGVANQLIAAVESWATRSSVSTLRLSVIPGNEPAIALYRRHGYQVTGELGDVLSDGVTSEHVMAKTLL